MHERVTFARATRVVIHSYLYSGLQPSVRRKITSDNGNLRNLRYNKNICYMILELITLESAHPIIQVEPLKPRFYTIMKFVYILVVNNNKY